jgi:hypothetical protein
MRAISYAAVVMLGLGFLSAPLETMFAIPSWAQTSAQPKKYRVLLVTHCDDPVGLVVASSLRDTFEGSNGYILVDKEVPGIFEAQLTCIQDGDRRAAMAFSFFLVVKSDPDIGDAAWGAKQELSTVNREDAKDKGEELFSRFDNWVHEH